MTIDDDELITNLVDDLITNPRAVIIQSESSVS
jgi:hypothetical protein